MEAFIKVYIKSEENLPKKHGRYLTEFGWAVYNGGWIYSEIKEGAYLRDCYWYLKPVELPEITDNHFSGQPEHTEPPLELRICTRCNKEFKAIGACPICPSCYL